MPRVTTYTDLRTHLKTYCDEVADTGEPLVIKRRGGAAHLLRSPANARRLLASVRELRSNGGAVLTVEELRQQYGLDA